MALQQEEFNCLRTIIEKACGITLNDQKKYLIESRLASVMMEIGAKDFGEFCQRARKDLNGQLRDKIVDAMTTNETLWFRDDKPWVTLREHLLPQWLQDLRKGDRRKVRIWSAASSTGQEPYSLAILIDELCRPGGAFSGVRPECFEILATDISPTALNLARNGRYNQIEIKRGMPSPRLERYFKQEGRTWELDPKIRNRVKFERFNLQDSFSRMGKFDMILCRNVAIYFSTEFKRDLYDRMANALNPEGILFLGSAESVNGLCPRFHSERQGPALFYRVTTKPS